MKTIRLHLAKTNRAEIRTEILGHWLQEEPGRSGHINEYRYNVEQLADGSWIYLKRPASLHKGCDFAIVCENFKEFGNGKPKPPKHDDLLNELRDLAVLSEEHRQELQRAMKRVFDCEDVEQVVANLNLFKGNLRAERALKLAKWLFIEQDINYWTSSGREMLCRTAIEPIVGELR